ncbi:MAG: hypothetical protein M1828_002089 [Chrysothrix sp. TS-e1954]|nr:MAG: hypothetical protein M1828_002089 [Chrysothrix sp. TS-e1954]
MKTNFRFSNLLGTVYSKGNLLFTPDGSTLLSPVGNRVTVFDLVHNTSYTLPLSHRRDIARLALNAAGNLLLSIDEDGRALLSHLPRRVVLYHLSFKSRVSALAFSPSGQYFAIGAGRFVEVWRTPIAPSTDEEGSLEFAPFVRHHVHAGHHDQVNSITWSSDSRFFISTSKDLTARVWSLNSEEGFLPTTLAGHRQAVQGAWFSADQETIYTISKDGALFEWKYKTISSSNAEGDYIDGEGDRRWRILQRHFYFQNNAHLTCATYHAGSNLIVAGFSNGVFTLHELPDFNTIHTLSISQNDIDFVDINQTGEWLAFGASKLGQLLVWEWQSESYILKQQGHFDTMNKIVYSPDGQKVITAADDGKIKVWDVSSGFCIVTFTEHTGGVTACEFAKRGNVLFTASLDGSVRAWDLVRYRNFRTFTGPTRLSFSSIAVDPSGEVICAGSLDSFDIHVWSVQTGQLLDQLAGHEGPVSTLSFATNGGVLVSGSWDHTVRMWSIFARTQTSEPLQLQADVLCVAFRPDSKQIAVSTLDGSLSFWSISDATQEGGLDARRDVSGGRKITDRRTAANVAGTKSFNEITYSADGTCILAGGNSKYICLYDVHSAVLLKKYTVSINLSLEGTQEYLNSRNLTEAGPRGLIDEQGEASDLENRIDRTLPGAKRGDLSERVTRPEIRVPSVAFSPTGRSFCAASTEGLLIYSLDNAFEFDPFDLDVTVTPKTTLKALGQGDHLRALIMAFRLNENSYIRHVYEGTPITAVQTVVEGLPAVHVPRLMRFVALATEENPHLEFNLMWIESLLSRRGKHLKANPGASGSELRLIQRALKKIQTDLGRLADENGFEIDYILESAHHEPSNDGEEVNGRTAASEDDWMGLED